MLNAFLTAPENVADTLDRIQPGGDRKLINFNVAITIKSKIATIMASADKDLEGKRLIGCRCLRKSCILIT